MIKKLISITLSIVLLFSVCSSGVSALSNETNSYCKEIITSKFNSGNARSLSYSDEEFARLSGIILSYLSEGVYTVDISTLELPCNDYSDRLINNCIEFITCDFPEFLTFKHFKVYLLHNPETNMYTGIEFRGDVSAYEKDLAKFQAQVDNIVRNIPKFKKNTDIEKVLYIYNYLILNFDYDYSLEIRDPLNFINEKKGVCEAYTLLFKAIMDKLEIKCISAYHDAQSANEAGHMWNMVEIEDEWYHVDATWGDTGNLGEVCYDYFLIDDTKLAKRDSQTQDHGNYYTFWEKIFSINGEDFKKGTKHSEDNVWEESSSPFTYCNGEWYYITDKNTESRSSALMQVYNNQFFDYTDSGTRISGIDEIWPYFDENGDLNSNYYWPGYYGSIFTLGNYVCLSSPSGIYYYDTTSKQKELKQLKLVDFSNSKIPIYGCTYDGHGNVTVEIKNNPNTLSCNADIKTYRVEAMKNYTATDLIKITKYLVGSELSENWGLYDISGDLGVDIRDLVRMKKISAEIE